MSEGERPGLGSIISDLLLSSVVSLISLNRPTIMTTPTQSSTLAHRHSTPICDRERQQADRNALSCYVVSNRWRPFFIIQHLCICTEAYATVMVSQYCRGNCHNSALYVLVGVCTVKVQTYIAGKSKILFFR